MPLVRYEVRCEHSLASPELFRAAGRDDPEGLLHGVAMAGLIGIVRQLGDLAEFAAEIFCDLHKELTMVGGRTHDLTVRVQQLEAELPAVEKALLSEPNQLRFAYTNGANWHASVRSDQNHCTSGELPRFVRNYYEECRGPPRLFLLDKFDVAGAGTCLKRYSDPSFFKLEWAKSELRKAQLGERDKKARQDKKKGRRRKTGHTAAALNRIPARVRYGSASLEDLDSHSPLLAPTLKGEIAPSATEVKRRPNASASHTEGGARKTSDKKDKSYQPNASENVAAGRMAGRISKIIEMEDRDAVPPVGLIPRNKKSPKSADRALKRSDSEAEAKRVTIESTTTRSENPKDGKAPGNSSLDSMPDIASRANVAPATSTSENLAGINGHVPDTSEAVDRRAPTGNPHQNNIANMPADGVDERNGVDVAPASRGEPDVDLSEAERHTDEVSEAVFKSPRLSPVRTKEVFAKEEEPQVISATSPNVSSQWSSPREDDLRPSASMLSRLSYSSELMPFSSGSEPESPVSPNSPPFNALYSPPGTPSRALGSPTGLYAHHSGYSSPHESEIPVLSSSPRSRAAGPSRPPPPVPENSQRQPRSTTSASVTQPSSTSPSRLTNSPTFHNSGAQLRSVDVPPNPSNDMLNSPGRQFEADSFSASGQANPPSSEISTLKQGIDVSFAEGEEESVPSSPTGSVIIKDTPSPPGSPGSNYSESGSEIHEYHHPAHAQPKSPMSPR